MSRIRVATIQIYERPTLIFEAIKKFSPKALYLPRSQTHPARWRFAGEKASLERSAREIGHSLIPWHEDMMHGDNAHTLSTDCHEQVEAEANFAAGRMLFLQDRFTDEALALEPTLASVRQLHGKFGNTMSTTRSIGSSRWLDRIGRSSG